MRLQLRPHHQGLHWAGVRVGSLTWLAVVLAIPGGSAETLSALVPLNDLCTYLGISYSKTAGFQEAGSENCRVLKSWGGSLRISFLLQSIGQNQAQS